MPTILNIETSTDVCSVALSKDGTCLYQRDDRTGSKHGTLLGVFVEEALSAAKESGTELDAVSISKGPGSYTGLRIGASMAKGLCFARNIRLISVSTLKTLCVPVLLYRDDVDDNALLCPMIDARRKEVYAAIYDRALHTIRATGADVVDENTYRPWLDRQPVVFFGNGSAKCKNIIKHPNARFIDDVVPLAVHMFPLSEKKFANNDFEDVAYFTPFYLKDFVAKPSKDLLKQIENT